MAFLKYIFFTGKLFKFDGFYSASQITIKDTSCYACIVFVYLILALIFTMVLNSYWPLLFNLYCQLKKSEQISDLLQLSKQELNQPMILPTQLKIFKRKGPKEESIVLLLISLL
jgi:hypothetical protein